MAGIPIREVEWEAEREVHMAGIPIREVEWEVEHETPVTPVGVNRASRAAKLPNRSADFDSHNVSRDPDSYHSALHGPSIDDGHGVRLL